MKRIFLLPLLLLSLAGFAQREDTLADVRLFVKVCNDYKRLPVRLEVDVLHQASYITRAEDTAHVQATFYIHKEGSYIRYGETEQLADDSVTVLVSSNLRRMIVYTHRQSVTAQLKMYLGWQLNDSSYLRLAKSYKAAKRMVGDTAYLTLTNRTQLPGSMLSKDSLVLRYDPATNQP